MWALRGRRARVRGWNFWPTTLVLVCEGTPSTTFVLIVQVVGGRLRLGCPVESESTKNFVITGLVPVTQPSRVYATKQFSAWECGEPFRRADARPLGSPEGSPFALRASEDRQEPGYDEVFSFVSCITTALRNSLQCFATPKSKKLNRTAAAVAGHDSIGCSNVNRMPQRFECAFVEGFA